MNPQTVRLGGTSGLSARADGPTIAGSLSALAGKPIVARGPSANPACQQIPKRIAELRELELELLCL